MKMPYTRVCIHYVWATKYRKPILIKPFREMLFNHIKQNAFAKGIHIDRINGYVDHAHCLVFLKPTQTINDIVQLIKGESAHWFNQQANAPPSKLQWQSDYFAVSVSESAIPNVQRYIDNQETHHQRKTFLQEYNAFLKYHGFSETN
ncbi:MAG: IS200/IS605 family transposase [Sediminibacterium magnilacihabitans]|nr:IS200/IS605 family transposase [Sediminibacterium magnilacihabitans]